MTVIQNENLPDILFNLLIRQANSMKLHRVAKVHHCKTNSLHMVSKSVRKKQGQSHDTEKVQELYIAWITFHENTF